MFENTVDLAGYDLVWRNKPDLPIANDENKKLEETVIYYFFRFKIHCHNNNKLN